jgi:hypothetical protein
MESLRRVVEVVATCSVLSLVQQLSGINAIIYYSSEIISENLYPDDEDLEKTDAEIYTIVIGVILAFCALLSGFYLLK